MAVTFQPLARLGAIAALSALAGCAASLPPPPRGAPAESLRLVDAAGARRSLRDLSGDAKLTVVEFFSATCPCQRAHDERLAALHARYAPRAVAFVAVGSEVDLDDAAAAREAAARHYPFPLVRDPGADLATALGAEFATYVVVLDQAGDVVYAGGIDSDRSHLTADAEPLLANALEALTRGRPAPRAATRVRGCALRTR